jgi:hypothetical protein
VFCSIGRRREVRQEHWADLPSAGRYAAYAVVLLWFLASFRSTIVQTDFMLLALAVAGLGFSVAVDVVETIIPLRANAAYLFEDGSKLFGIVSWAAYFVTVSARQIARA